MSYHEMMKFEYFEHKKELQNCGGGRYRLWTRNADWLVGRKKKNIWKQKTHAAGGRDGMGWHAMSWNMRFGLITNWLMQAGCKLQVAGGSGGRGGGGCSGISIGISRRTRSDTEWPCRGVFLFFCISE